ncbi:MAG: queuosine precursor transporter [Ruminococcus flavefaciens]|nr:queuosine precursor transporter [Ruminococcus flavefaciens]
MMNKEIKDFNCSVLFLYLSIIFVACLMISNILAAKILKIGDFSITAGVLVFPVSYIINDILSEVYGYSRARNIIILGFILNIFMVLIIQIAIMLPSPEWFNNNEAFVSILGSTPRVVLAGLLAYLSGSLVNAKILTRMKREKNSRFGVRAIVSTVFGETTDSIVFVPIAFLGTVSFKQMLGMVFIQVITKTCYEVICLPVTSFIVIKIKKYESIIQEKDNE